MISDSNSIEKSKVEHLELSDGADIVGEGDRIGDINEFLDKSTPLYKQKHMYKLFYAVFMISLLSTNNGYDGSMLNGLQSLETWKNKMGNPSADELGHLSNGTIYGALIALLFAPYLADKFGRRAGVFIGCAINALGSILQGVSTSYVFFLVSRIVLGLGTGITVVAAPALVSEISHPSIRGPSTAFYNTCWYLGSTIAAWVTLGTGRIETQGSSIPVDYSWRIPSYLQGFIPILQMVTILTIPESPRYYISKGKHEKAEKMLKNWHIGNSTKEIDLNLVEFEMKEIEIAIEMEKIQSSSSYYDFIKLKNFRKRLFLVLYTPCLMQLSGNGLVSYYLNKVLDSINIKDTEEQLVINGALMTFNMVIAMSAAFIIKFFRRRTLFLASLIAMLTCYILWTILSALAAQRDYPASLSNGVLAFIFLYYASYDLGMNGLPILFITEVLPYSHRAKGLNIFSLAQTCTLIFNGYVNPIGMERLDWKYYIVWCCNLAVEVVVVYFFYPETSNRTLEEVAEVFGDNIKDTMFLPDMTKVKIEQVENV